MPQIYVRGYVRHGNDAQERRGAVLKTLRRLVHVPLRAVTSERLTDFVGHLDRKVQDGKISASHAVNIWCTVRAMFRDATKHKDRSIRVLDLTPARRVFSTMPAATGDYGVCAWFRRDLLTAGVDRHGCITAPSAKR